MADERSTTSQDSGIGVLTCEQFTPKTPRAYLSNGLIGLRPGPNPLDEAPAYASGYVRPDGRSGSESLAPLPYPLRTQIIVGDARLLECPDRVTVASQSLDMATGELCTRMTFAPSDAVRLEIEVFQFLSRWTPCLACQEIRITLSADAHVVVAAAVRDVDDPALGIALVEPTREAFTGKAGQTFVFLTMAAVVTDAYHPRPARQAERMAGWANLLGYSQLHRLNRQVWGELWRSRLRVVGDDAAQRSLDAAFFYVHSSCHPSCLTGISPGGLSGGVGVGGHIRDEMDAWICPAVLPAAPETARGMLDYRLGSLPAARAAAGLYGFRGAHFPVAGGRDGQDVTPPDDPGSWEEHLATVRVGLAFWEYYLATGDEDFLRRGVWPVLSDVATWIESRGEFTPEGFEIPNVGAAGETVRNRADVNLLSRMALSAAIRCAGRIGYTPPDAWQTVARSMVIPVDGETGAISWYAGAVPTSSGDYLPGAVQMAFFHDPIEYGSISLDQLRRTWELEEDLREAMESSPTNPGSEAAPGFTAAALSACAAFFGDRAQAARLFHVACDPYQMDPFMLMRRYRDDDDGEDLTGHASLLLAAMYAFSGVRLREGDWAKYQARLPEGWQRIEMDRIWVRGVPMHMIVDHGKRARLIQV